MEQIYTKVLTVIISACLACLYFLISFIINMYYFYTKKKKRSFRNKIQKQADKD